MWSLLSFYHHSILGILCPNVKLLIVQKNVPHIRLKELLLTHWMSLNAKKSIKAVVPPEKLHFQFCFFPQPVQNMCIINSLIYSMIAALFSTVLIKTITCFVCMYSHYWYDIIELSQSAYMAFLDSTVV